MQDERLNLSSGSKFYIDAACPGNQNLLNTLPEQSNQDNEMALRGRRLHSAWEKDSTDELNAEEIEDFEKGKSYSELAINQWAKDNAIEHLKELPREQRLWLHDLTTLNPILSGQLDRCFIVNEHALILDYKSGWNVNLIPSEMSWQLRVYAVLLWKEHPKLSRIRVGFVKPKSHIESTDCTDYSLSDLQHSEHEIHHVLWKIKQPDAQRVPGTHCNFCAAKPFCPEAGAFSLLPSVIARDASAMVSQLKIEDCVRLWEKSSVITDILEAAKDRLKALPLEELQAHGLKLGKPRKLDPITDTKGAFDLLAENVTHGALWTTLKISKSELASVLSHELKITKAEAAKWIAHNLSAFITKTESKPALQRIK